MKKYIDKKSFKAAIYGAITGAVLFSLTSLLHPEVASDLRDILKIVFAPASWGANLFDLVIKPFCPLSQTNVCRGLGFDGGPLEWLEWTFVILGMIVVYALISFLISVLLNYYRARKTQKVK